MGNRNGALFIETRLRSGKSKSRVLITNKTKRYSSFSKGLDRFLGQTAPYAMDVGDDITVCRA
jgi:hypothetical protein